MGGAMESSFALGLIFIKVTIPRKHLTRQKIWGGKKFFNFYGRTRRGAGLILLAENNDWCI
jgi:hypothetical protein